MRKESVSRFSISMSADLIRRLDAMTKAKGFSNRSHAISQMVRENLVEHHGQIGDHEIAGTITLVYDHHKRNIQALLTAIQHDHGNLIIAALHVHLDHHHCMEVLAVRGKADEIREMADKLMIAKGVKHGKLAVTSTEKELKIKKG
jgi:CopG family nickel-responsive transcriptional regulator